MDRLIISCVLVIITSNCCCGQNSSEEPLSLPDVGLNENTIIGTKVFYLTDSRRKEKGSSSLSNRSVIIQSWYPASLNGEDTAAYILDKAFMEMVGQKAKTRLEDVRISSFLNARVVGEASSLPVILFSPGFGMSRHYYTYLYQFLASKGYVVIAVDHPHLNKTVLQNGNALNPENGPFDAFPGTKPAPNIEEGRSILFDTYAFLKDDAELVVSYLKDQNQKEFQGKLDLNRLGYIGHSAGAMATKGCIIDSDLPFEAYVTIDVRIDREWINSDSYIDIPNNTTAPILMLGLQYVNQFAPVPNNKYLSSIKGTLEIHLLKDINHSAISEFDYLYYQENNMQEDLLKAEKDLINLTNIICGFLNRHLQ